MNSDEVHYPVLPEASEMTSDEVHSALPEASEHTSKPLSKRQRRKGKNKAEAFEAASKNASFSKATYTNPYAAFVTNEDGSTDKKELSDAGADDDGADDDGADDDGPSEPELSDVEDLEEIKKREALLEQGAEKAYDRRKNGNRKNIPPHVAKILQDASWIYRLAWKFGSDENLRREVDKTNQELARQPVDPVYVRTFQKEKDKEPTLYASSDQKTPLEKYKDTFMMNKALIDVISLLKEKVEEWQNMRTGPEKARVAQKLIISMVGQRDTLFYMGLTWKSIVEPSYLESFLQVVHEGLSVSGPKLRDLVKAWVECDDINPTTLQSQIMSKAPAHLNRIFTGYANGEDVQEIITVLSRSEKDIIASNVDMRFKQTDHADLQLGLLRSANEKLQKMKPGKARNALLQSFKINYASKLTRAGWGSLIEEIDALKFSKVEAKALDEQKRKFIMERKPTDQMVIDSKSNDEHRLGKETKSSTESVNDQTTQAGSGSMQDELSAEELEELIGKEFQGHDSHEEVSDDEDEDEDAVDESLKQKDSNIKQEDDDDLKPRDWPKEFDNDHTAPESESDTESQSGAQTKYETYTEQIRNMPKTPGLFDTALPSFTAKPQIRKNGGYEDYATQTKPQVYKGFRKTFIPGPIKVESRTTTKGYLIGGRLAGGCSSRHIVNIGTFANPVHAVLSGYEFGGRNTGPSLVRKYPLPSPNLPSKAEDRHASDVLCLYDMVEAAPPATGDRRPVTYYCIQWKTPGSEPLWLSRGELISVTGKAWLDNKNRKTGEPSRHEQVYAVWQHNLKFIAAMKSGGLNPDTMEPLSSSDSAMPWLFKSVGQ